MIHGLEFGRGESPGNPRNVHRDIDAITGAFKLLDDLNLDVGFIDEPGLADPARLQGTSVVVVPDALAVEPRTIAQLHAFAEAGGTVIADGLTGLLDPWARLNTKDTHLLSCLFGASVRDIEPTDELELAVQPVVPGWFNRVWFDVSGDAML